MIEVLSDPFGQKEFMKLGMASSTMQWTFEHVEEAPLGWKVPTYLDFLETQVPFENAYYCYAIDHRLGDVAKRVRYHMDLYAREHEMNWMRIAKRMGDRRKELFLHVVTRRLARAARYLQGSAQGINPLEPLPCDIPGEGS